MRLCWGVRRALRQPGPRLRPGLGIDRSSERRGSNFRESRRRCLELPDLVLKTHEERQVTLTVRSRPNTQLDVVAELNKSGIATCLSFRRYNSASRRSHVRSISSETNDPFDLHAFSQARLVRTVRGGTGPGRGDQPCSGTCRRHTGAERPYMGRMVTTFYESDDLPSIH